MKGFRGTGRDPSAARPTFAPVTRPRTPATKPLMELVVEELAAGQTLVQVAQNHSLPRDFVELVAQRAREQGNLDYFELTKGSCTTGRCDPDPESLVCAGCPVLPAAVRRRQSLVGKLAHRQ